jgi:hypothetical protein
MFQQMPARSLQRNFRNLVFEMYCSGERTKMKLTLGVIALLLFGLSVIFLFLLTVFESSLSGIPQIVERIVSALLLIAPGIVGVILGAMSLQHKESPRWLAILAILLNALFALFHLFVLSFAG